MSQVKQNNTSTFLYMWQMMHVAIQFKFVVIDWGKYISLVPGRFQAISETFPG